ncbi:MAG: S9 family peptidase [Alphaproteobacteria bacterium]|nr:S9 family peptidase [Alphaproteobacteria bacterium]
MNLRWILGLALALAATAAIIASATAAFGPNDLIPRKVLFGNPERTAPYLSPDGKKIAFTAAVGGVMNLWVAPVDDMAAAKAVTQEKRRPIMKYFWARNGDYLLYLQDQGGNENFHLYAVDLDTNTTRDLTPHKNVRAEVIADSYERPDELLIGLNNRDARWHDVWLINVVTGEAKLVLKNDGFTTIIADNDLEVRLASKSLPDGGQEYFRFDGTAWKPFATVPGDDALTTEPLFFDTGNKSIYMIDSRGRDKSALVKVDMATRKSTVVGAADKADVAYIIKHPETHEILAYASEYDRMEWKALKSEIKADIAFLDKQVSGYWAVLSQSQDGELWTLWIDNPGEPIRFALFDRDKRALKTLFAARPSLEGAPLPRTQPHVIEARDGLELVSYLTLPKGSDGDGDGVPDKPLPLVLHVHGGPWSRDSFAYNPTNAWLANRGYAVLAVNFRGSTGFGKAFVNAGDKQWAGKMQDDLVDAVDWAVGERIAHKDKVAIYGGSYGGYAALVGLTFTPKKFACGVSIVGPSNLQTMLSNVPPYWASMLDTFKRRVGDPSTAAGKALLKNRSPLFRASQIERPLLLAHGANDPRIKQTESNQIARAAARKGAAVTYVLYADEGHGFARPENRLSFFAISEAFLAQCLSGRAEPIGADFAGSSVAVPAGRQFITGLKEALAHP